MLFFAAEWSDESKLMQDVVDELIKNETYQNNVRFLQIEAEQFEDLSIKYNVEVVPSFIFLKVKY